MSAENVEMVRTALDALARGGVEGLIEVIPPEFEFTTSAAVASEPGTYRGHDGARRYFDEFYEAMDEIRVEPHRFHDLGDKVAVDFTLRARGRTTEIETSIDAVQLWDVTGGIVRKATIYRTLEEARAAA